VSDLPPGANIRSFTIPGEWSRHPDFLRLYSTLVDWVPDQAPEAFQTLEKGEPVVLDNLPPGAIDRLKACVHKHKLHLAGHLMLVPCDEFN